MAAIPAAWPRLPGLASWGWWLQAEGGDGPEQDLPGVLCTPWNERRAQSNGAQSAWSRSWELPRAEVPSLVCGCIWKFLPEIK